MTLCKNYSYMYEPTRKISREELRKCHLYLSDEQFDIIFPRKFYYLDFYYCCKEYPYGMHFMVMEIFNPNKKGISEAKIVACYDHQITRDDTNIRNYIVRKFGKDLWKSI